MGSISGVTCWFAWPGRQTGPLFKMEVQDEDKKWFKFVSWVFDASCE